jgi:hypothetical protein
MKRVALLVTALPAAAGLALPLVTPSAAGAATAARTGKTVSTTLLQPAGPNSVVGPCSSRCVAANGGGNDIAHAAATHWKHSLNSVGTLYLAYRTPHRGTKSKWKSFTARWKGNGSHTWSPACSFSTGTHISAWSKTAGFGARTLPLSVHGTNFTDLHPCA